MFCGYCGKEIWDNATFCSYCGKPIKPMTATRPAAENRTEQPAEAEKPVRQTTPEQNAATQQSPVYAEPTVSRPAAPERTKRVDTVNDFVSVPADWLSGGDNKPQQTQPVSSSYAPNRTTATEQTTGIADTVKEKTAQYGAVAKEKTVQVGTTAKDAAVKYGRIAKEKAEQTGVAAKEKAIQYGKIAKEQAVKLGTAAKEKAAKGVGKLQTAPLKKIEKQVTAVMTVISISSLLLIALAVFAPYCRIAYSADRATNMPLWKLIAGGTYFMGSSNPLQFTLRAHPEMLALLLLPLPALLPLFFRKSKAKLWITSGTLFAVGLITIIWNGAVLRTIKNIVSGLSLETFETHIKSMNGVVIKWVQSVLADNLSFANTFMVSGRIGWGLIGLFGWLLLLSGIIGTVVCFMQMSAKKKTPSKQFVLHTTENESDEDVPEL